MEGRALARVMSAIFNTPSLKCLWGMNTDVIEKLNIYKYMERGMLDRYLVTKKIKNKECRVSQTEACLSLMIILLRVTKSASQPLPLEKNIPE